MAKVQKESKLLLKIIFSPEFKDDIDPLADFLASNPKINERIILLDFSKVDFSYAQRSTKIAQFLSQLLYLEALAFPAILLPCDKILDLKNCSFPRLKSLTFDNISGKVLLPRNFAELRTLSFGNISNLYYNDPDNEAADLLSQSSFPQLENLSFKGISTKILLPQQLPNLTTLIISNCSMGCNLDLSQCYCSKLEIKDINFIEEY